LGRVFWPSKPYECGGLERTHALGGSGNQTATGEAMGFGISIRFLLTLCQMFIESWCLFFLFGGPNPNALG
jgi:hypothetical protein